MTTAADTQRLHSFPDRSLVLAVHAVTSAECSVERINQMEASPPFIHPHWQSQNRAILSSLICLVYTGVALNMALAYAMAALQCLPCPWSRLGSSSALAFSVLVFSFYTYSWIAVATAAISQNSNLLTDLQVLTMTLCDIKVADVNTFSDRPSHFLCSSDSGVASVHLHLQYTTHAADDRTSVRAGKLTLSNLFSCCGFESLIQCNWAWLLPRKGKKGRERLP